MIQFNPADWFEWIYSRPEGDLSVFAPTLELAIAELKNHGFTKINPNKLTMHDRRLTDVLHKKGII